VLLVLVNEHADSKQHVIMVARMVAMIECPHPNMFLVVVVVVGLGLAKCRRCLKPMKGKAVVQ